MEKYNSIPENKAKRKEYGKKYNSIPENKAKKKEHSDRPENKAKRKKVRDRPENKAREKARRQTDEYKKKAKLRKLTPENKAKTKNRNRNNNIRFTKEKLKYGNICTCCGLTDIHNLTKDHIIPLSKGGTDTPDNIQLHCFACNCSKGDRLKCTLPHDQEFYDLI
jgi:ATPase subunit of ABC transporter with duplicated ATPase domains